MSVRAMLMMSAVLLTLVLPAVLSSWLSNLRKVHRHLTGLALGLILQIIGELILVWAGARAWLPALEAPFIGVRLVQLLLLLRMNRQVINGKRGIFLAAIVLNFMLWLLVGYRLLGRL